MAVRLIVLIALLSGIDGGLVQRVHARFRALRLNARLGSAAGTGQCRMTGGAGMGRSSVAPPTAASVTATSTRRARHPFFEGWAVRAVDARLGVVMVIIGSFRSANEARYSSHLLVLQHHPPGEHEHDVRRLSADRGRVEQQLMAGEDVEIISPHKSVPLTAPSANGRPVHFTWRVRPGAAAAGSFVVNGSHAVADFSMRGLGVRIQARGRTPWDRHQPRAGPEGWLRRLGGLLPCRYFVHSLGSAATMTVTTAVPAPQWPPWLAGVPSTAQRGAQLRSEAGLVHIEGNYGRLFPAGWTWVHAIAPVAGAVGAVPRAHSAMPAPIGSSRGARSHAAARFGLAPGLGGAPRASSAPPGAVSLLAVGGLFQIGLLTTRTWIIAFRQPAAAAAGGHGAEQRAEQGAGEMGQPAREAGQAIGGPSTPGLAWDFRTTDGDTVAEQRSSCDGRLSLDAISRDGRRRLVVTVGAPRAQFGPPIYVPTATGFSNAPGCTEAHGATVRVHAYTRSLRPAGSLRRKSAGRNTTAAGSEGWVPAGSHTLRLGALEFGGKFTCKSAEPSRS